jgi:hypothetical protein
MHVMKMRIVIVAGLLSACSSAGGTYTAHLSAPSNLAQIAQELTAYGYKNIKIVDGTVTAAAKSQGLLEAIPMARESSSADARPEIETKTLVVSPHGSTLALQIDRTTCIWDGSSFTGACAARGTARDRAARQELATTSGYLERRLGHPGR